MRLRLLLPSWRVLGVALLKFFRLFEQLIKLLLGRREPVLQRLLIPFRSFGDILFNSLTFLIVPCGMESPEAAPLLGRHLL